MLSGTTMSKDEHFPKCWLNEATTEAGLDALRYYHEQR
jgi:hypothetical protein